MCTHAKKEKNKFPNKQIIIKQGDALTSEIAENSVDIIVCCFGIKTLNDIQQQQFAIELNRILKVGGYFSFIEISIPSNKSLKLFYKFYLKRCIPFIGNLFLGNPDNYRNLYNYTEKFNNAKSFHEKLMKLGLESQYNLYFYGCATGVSGRKCF